MKNALIVAAVVAAGLAATTMSRSPSAELPRDASAAEIGNPAATRAHATSNSPSHDNSAKHPVWIIESASNRTYLLGSIHVLRDEDYPLPEVFQHAYNDAEHLVMELDFTDLDTLATLATTRRLAMLPPSESLSSVMGPSNYLKATKAANQINVDLEQFARVDPWYAAMTITQLQLGRLGFKAENGIELHFARQAKRDAKSGSGLETIEEQLGILDALPTASQTKFLLESLVDANELKIEGERMIAAWKSGDSERLYELFAEDLKDNPDLYSALLVERNLAWLPRIVEFTEKTDDYLVIVGALHLVGQDGVIELLRQQGVSVRQL